MQTLRQAHLTARLVLAAWVLAILGMVGLPHASGQEGSWVCLGSGGVTLVFAKAASAHPAGMAPTSQSDADTAMGLHCPLCASAALITPAVQTANFLAVGLSHVLLPATHAHPRQVMAAHWRARGPPSL